MINGISYPKFYIYDSANTTLVETIELKYRAYSQPTETPSNGDYDVNYSPFSRKRKFRFNGYRLKEQIKLFSPERWSSILSFQASQNDDTTEQDLHKAVRIVDYCNAGYTIRYVPHVHLEDVYGYTYTLVHVWIDGYNTGARNRSDYLTLNVEGVDVDTYWTPFRKFDMVNCISLDGVNDYVSFASSFDIGTTHSIEFFADFSLSGGNQYITYDSTSSGSYVVFTSNSIVYQAQGSFRGETVSSTSGTKNHWAVTRSGTSISTYKNGALIASNSLSGSNNTFKINNLFQASGASYFTGKFGLLRIYNSVLTADQVKRQYNNGYGNPPIDISRYLILEYDTTGGTSTTETDQSGNGRTGTLQNGVVRTTW